MKLVKIINPKNLSPSRLFRSKKDRSRLSRFDPSSSFSSGTASSSSSSSFEASVSNKKPADSTTPTSVLPGMSGDWSDPDIVPDLQSELAEALRLIDRDNDGLVSRVELEALLRRLGANPPSPEEVSAMLSEVDRLGDGCISVATLTNRIGLAGEPTGDDELREAFEFFDADHDGRITAEELRSVFTAFGDEKCTLEECRRMIGHVGKSGDGFVCFDDFSRMMALQR